MVKHYISSGVGLLLWLATVVLVSRPSPSSEIVPPLLAEEKLFVARVDVEKGEDNDECGVMKPCQSLEVAVQKSSVISLSCGIHHLKDTLRLTRRVRLVGDKVDAEGEACEAVVSGGSRVFGLRVDENTWMGKSPVSGFLMLSADNLPLVRSRTPVRELGGWDRQNGSYVEWAEGDPGVEMRPGLQISLFESWTAPRYRVTGINATSRRIYISPSLLKPSGASSSPKGRYFVDGLEAHEENSWSELDGIVTIKSSSPIKNVVAHRLRELLVVTSIGSRIENVVFEHADVDDDCLDTPPEHCNGQAASFLETAAIKIENCSDVAIENVKVRRVGGYAVWIKDNANRVRVGKLEANDLGAGGVRIGLPRSGSTNSVAESAPADVAIVDSTLTDGGNWYPEGIGILVQEATRAVVINNTVDTFRYTGISVGWTWSWAKTLESKHFISQNRVSNIGMQYLSDLGGMYFLGDLEGTVVSHNSVQLVTSFDYPANHGIYLDQSSSNLIFLYNLVHTIQCDGLFIHYGMNNTFVNNVFADLNALNGTECSGFGAVRSPVLDGSCDTARDDRDTCISFNFTRNIVYVDFLDDDVSPMIYGPSSYANSHFDYNLYFNRRTMRASFAPNNEPIETWQKNFSHDLHSMVTDPLFVDPRKGDYGLRPDSPARLLGIESLSPPSAHSFVKS